MPVRDIDNLLYNSEVEVYANRGANGIDGVVSTAIGMAVHKKITLIIGDLAFYHDMNGLLMAKINNINLNIVYLIMMVAVYSHIFHKKHLLKHILNVCLERRLD